MKKIIKQKFYCVQDIIVGIFILVQNNIMYLFIFNDLFVIFKHILYPSATQQSSLN